MISRQEIIDYFVDKKNHAYNEETDMLKDNESGFEFNAQVFTDMYKKKNGQSFECIYNDHASLFNVIRCTECGAVIFEHYDESYEENLKCPICTDYKTGFKYWTQSDIEKDDDKMNLIKFYKECQKIMDETDKRYIERGNLYDWERTHKRTILKTKNRKVKIQVQGEKIRDLKILIWLIKNNAYTHKFTIPLGYNSFYIKYIYRHLGKCHKDLRSKFYIGKAREDW